MKKEGERGPQISKEMCVCCVANEKSYFQCSHKEAEEFVTFTVELIFAGCGPQRVTNGVLDYAIRPAILSLGEILTSQCFRRYINKRQEDM